MNRTDQTIYVPGSQNLHKALAGVFDLYVNQPSFTTKDFERYKPMLKEAAPEWGKILEAALSPKSRKELLEQALALTNHTTNFNKHIAPLLERKLLSRTVPDKPNSQFQKYFTTEKGKILLQLLN